MSCENQVTSGTFPPSHRTSSQQYREHGWAVGGQEGGEAAPIEEVESPRRPDFGRLWVLLAPRAVTSQLCLYNTKMGVPRSAPSSAPTCGPKIAQSYVFLIFHG